MQIYELDYLDIFASVAKLASLWIILAIAMIEDLEIYQMNVIAAFLAGDLNEKIYMKQSKEFKQGIEKEDLVCLLRKSLYDLKQISRVWNQRIR